MGLRSGTGGLGPRSGGDRLRGHVQGARSSGSGQAGSGVWGYKQQKMTRARGTRTSNRASRLVNQSRGSSCAWCPMTTVYATVPPNSLGVSKCSIASAQSVVEIPKRGTATRYNKLRSASSTKSQRVLEGLAECNGTHTC